MSADNSKVREAIKKLAKKIDETTSEYWVGCGHSVGKKAIAELIESALSPVLDKRDAELRDWRERFGARPDETPERCREIWQTALDEQDILRAQLADARREMEWAREDSKRLDWLRDTACDLAESNGGWYVAGLSTGPTEPQPSPRSAIDAARAADSGREGT